MDHEEYKRKALEPIINYIESVMASYSKEELEARIKEALPERESEDERIRKGLIAFVDKYYGEETKKPVLAWLEKHKEQQSAEWSEEDDAFRDLLICILKTEHPNGIFSMSAKHISVLKCDVMPVNRIIDWLKSLRPQPHWKPSEEQMEALLELEKTYVLEHERTQETAHLYMIIKSLREQLLKLM